MSAHKTEDFVSWLRSIATYQNFQVSGEVKSYIKALAKHVDDQEREIEQLRERIRSCSTMPDAQKIALVRLAQELAETVGIDPAASSPADVVTAVSETIDRLRKALEDIKRHQELVGGSMGKAGATWRIADKALKG